MPQRDDNPIHRMRTSEFATLVETTLFAATGGRDQMSHGKNDDGTVETTHPIPGRDTPYHVERENPDSPMGPPKSQVKGLALATVPEDRKRHGNRPTLSGGITGGFGELHHAFMNVGKQYGRVLDLEHIGNDAEQNTHIKALVKQWSDFQPSAKKRDMAWEKGGDYPLQLAEAFASLKTVPVKLKVNGEDKVFQIPNVRTGLTDMPLAHVLFAAGKNGVNLSVRPSTELKFITSAVSDFSRILEGTDKVYDYLKAELEKQGVAEPDKVLNDSKLGFDSRQAEQLLLRNVPFMKLSAVISPLTMSHSSNRRLQPLLECVGESMETLPPVQNAEHGARLLEALLYRVTDFNDRIGYPPKPEGEATTAEVKGLDTKEIKRYLRQSAMDAPFDVARLTQHPGVQRMLQYAREDAKEDTDVERAMQTLDKALAHQKELGGARDAAAKALTHQPSVIERARHRVMTGKPAPRKAESSLLSAIDSGMNTDELQAMVAEVVRILSHDDPAKQQGSFSELVREQMRQRAERARKDVPPLP